MKLEITNLAICRTPAFSLDSNFDEEWVTLKGMIKESSSTFYHVIDQKDLSDLNESDRKIKYTVWKYFNRSKYRATPFGAFAAFTIVPLANDTVNPVCIAHEMIPHKYVDWKEKDLPSRSLLSERTTFLRNSTIYEINNNEVRYLRCIDGQFEITSVTAFPQLIAIVEHSRCKVAMGDICEMMASVFSLEKKFTINLLSQMVDMQLLLTDQNPNITGDDYFKRIGFKSADEGPKYLISERMRIDGGIDTGKLKHIPEFLCFLNKYLLPEYSKDLEAFKRSFLKKFEQRAVPLSVVMDPELGIGYGQLEQQQLGTELTDLLRFENRIKAENPNIQFTEFHGFILKKLIENKPIHLEDFAVVVDASTVQQLPNTLSIMLHFWGAQPVIEAAGGSTANSLLGRFTLASKDLEDYGRYIASVEEKVNPDVFFFEIAYQAEKEIDNVNRRKLLYKYELPILTWSTQTDPLRFDDVLVSIKENEVILFSAQYGKRLVPRISSAYNYGRSDLASYRFLCDVQNQSLRTNLNFRLPGYFPDLDYYPRVYFKDIIVSPAMWKIPADLFDNFDAADYNYNRLVSWLQKMGVTSEFKSGTSDNTLCFDPKTKVDMDYFIMYFQQQKGVPVYISEALLSKEDAVKDAEGRAYIGQLVFNYVHHTQVYKPVRPEENKYDEQAPGSIQMPGDDWLYFEIYCHSVRSNELLIKYIQPFIKEVSSCYREWFFIRYQNPDPHIRLRFRLKDPALGFNVIREFNTVFKPLLKIGIVQDCAIKVYHPEIERYGAQYLRSAESFFYFNSRFVLHLLSKTEDMDQLYATSLVFIQHVFFGFIGSLTEQIHFTKSVLDRFIDEMKLGPNDFKVLNRSVKHIQGNLHNLTISSGQRLRIMQLKILSQLFDNDMDHLRREKLIIDMIHMYVNRLFSSDQRMHETVVYYHLWKVLLTRNARMH